MAKKNVGSVVTRGDGILVTGADVDHLTLLHEAPAGTSHFHVVGIRATNNDTVDRTVTVCFAGTAGKDYITRTIPSKSGLSVVVDAERIWNGGVVYAFASVANKITLRVDVDEENA